MHRFAPLRVSYHNFHFYPVKASLALQAGLFPFLRADVQILGGRIWRAWEAFFAPCTNGTSTA